MNGLRWFPFSSSLYTGQGSQFFHLEPWNKVDSYARELEAKRDSSAIEYPYFVNDGPTGECLYFPVSSTDSSVRSYLKNFNIDNTFAANQEATFCCWIKPSSIESIDGAFPAYNAIVGIDSGNGTGEGFVIAVGSFRDDYGETFRPVVWHFADKNAYVHATTSTLINNDNSIYDLDTWHHFAVTLNTEKQKVQIYMDGELLVETTVGWMLDPIFSGRPTWIGAVPDTLLNNMYYSFQAEMLSCSYHGKLSDLRWYHEVLPAKKIKDLAKGLVEYFPMNWQKMGMSGYQLYYPNYSYFYTPKYSLDHTQTSNLRSFSYLMRIGNSAGGNRGFPSSLKSIDEPNRHGNQAINLQPGSSYAFRLWFQSEFPHYLEFTKHLALGCWFKANNISEENILFQESRLGLSVSLTGARTITFSIFNITHYINIATSLPSLTEQMHHIVAVVDKEASTAKLYLNGKHRDTISISESNWNDYHSVSPSAAWSICVGGGWTLDLGYMRTLKGIMTGFKVYATKMTLQDVIDWYEMGAEIITVPDVFFAGQRNEDEPGEYLGLISTIRPFQLEEHDLDEITITAEGGTMQSKTWSEYWTWDDRYRREEYNPYSDVLIGKDGKIVAYLEEK